MLDDRSYSVSITNLGMFKCFFNELFKMNCLSFVPGSCKSNTTYVRVRALREDNLLELPN
jgi:hypothetical protein